MDIPFIILIGFSTIVIFISVKNFKKDIFENKKVAEYVIIVLAIFLGAVMAYPYYSDVLPIALWSAASGAIAALIVEARRNRGIKK